MSCEEFERLILDRDERPISEDEKGRLAAHLRACQDCRNFEAERHVIRKALRSGLPAAPPNALDVETLRLCLEAERPARAGVRLSLRRAGLPAPILIALGLLTVLTVVWLAVSLADFDPGQTLRPATVAAIVLIAQNALILFFAPVLLRRRRFSQNGIDTL